MLQPMIRVRTYSLALIAGVLVIGAIRTHAQKSQPSPSPAPAPAPAESPKQGAQQDRVYSGEDVDVKAKIKRSNEVPQPGTDCHEFGYKLQTVMKVVLHKSGIVSEVIIIKKSGCSFDQESIRVARKIKFEPAKKDGEPVSQYILVEYNFERP
jgi:Gram-negative bacterial TonB protein C-terminal